MQSSSQEKKDHTATISITSEAPRMINEPADLTERAKAILAAELAAGGTLYGIRADGCYIARTKDGDRILKRPPKFRPA